MVISKSLGLSTLLATAATATSAMAATSHGTLNVTVVGAQDNASTLECWAVDPGFEESNEAGVAGAEELNLGALDGNATFSIIPAGFDGGLHNAPALQWVVFISGQAHITLPESDAEAWVQGGKNGVIMALDTPDVSAKGHYTSYPSDEETVALLVPFGAKGIPGHRVLHNGACKGDEVGV